MGIPYVAINTPNDCKYFLPADDKWELEYLKTKVSLEMDEGVAMQYETSGAATTGYVRTMVAVENLNGDDTIGILAQPVSSTDPDYATDGKKKGVYMPTTPEAKAYFYVGAGTFTEADVGKTVELHSDFKSLAVDTVGKGATIVGYIDSTHGICKFNLPHTETA